MKGISKTTKLLLGLGLGYTVLYGLGISRLNSLRESQNQIKPLTEVVKEAELFDKRPRDSILSILEAEDFIKGSQDKNNNGTIEQLETEQVKKLADAFKNEQNFNTQITAKNLQSALEFVLIRQRLKESNNQGTQFIPKQEREAELTYSDFYRYAFQEEKPLIKSVILQNNSDNMIAVFLDNSSNVVRIPSDLTTLNDLANKLATNGIEVEIKEAEKPGMLVPLLVSLVPVALLLLVMFYLASRNQNFMSQLTGIKKSKGGKEERPKVTFNDVAGIDEVKEELQEVVEFLKNPNKYQSIGAKVPKGVLLVGPPGTGKTLCAKAVAGEANVPFFSLSGSDFVEMFVGVGAARVRDLFNNAKKTAPCVIFIDEIDAVGRHRGAGLGGGHDEREQTLNQLLVEMDGFDAREGIVLLAATNRPDILDTALLRAGRFDRQIVVDRPDVRGREAILKVHVKEKPLATGVDLKIIAQMTPGFTGADLANLINEAALLAGRKNKNEITMDELEEAIDKVIAGPEKKSKIISPKDKKITAYHEIGHALIAFYEKNSDPLHKVTIIPRGMALGLTMTRPEEDHLNYSKSQLLTKIKVLLGGRIAEEIVFGEGEITTGAQNDLERATDLLRKMITKFGMSEKLGPLTFGQTNEQVFLGRDFGSAKNYSENIASQIDEEMKKMITTLYKEVKIFLNAKRKYMDALSQVLLKKETMDKDEFAKVIEDVDNGTFKSEEEINAFEAGLSP